MDSENYGPAIILGFLTLITLITGILLAYFPPKKINWFYGYRTKRSSKNQEQWDFSQRYSGRLFLMLSAILFVFLVLAILWGIKGIYGEISVVVIFVIGVILIIFLTEEAIVREFKE